jgi:hypothetical protein
LFKRQNHLPMVNKRLMFTDIEQWCLPTPKRKRHTRVLTERFFCRHHERHAIYWWPTIGIRRLSTSKDDVRRHQRKAQTFTGINTTLTGIARMIFTYVKIRQTLTGD